MKNYYRITILYKGEGKPYHNTSGGNMVVAGESEEQVRIQTESFFKNLLVKRGYPNVDFVTEIYKISEDEVKYYSEKGFEGMVN